MPLEGEEGESFREEEALDSGLERRGLSRKQEPKDSFDLALHRAFQPADTEKLQKKDQPPVVPEHWTILYHGSNLGRDEWKGEKSKVLDADEMTIRARWPGLSCITQEDRERDESRSKRMNARYDTTKGYSTVPKGKENKPLEIRVLFPGFHSQAPKRRTTAEPYYVAEYGEERTRKVLEFANKVHNSFFGHPVVSNGTVLDRLKDETLDDGRRIVWYVPKELHDIYVKETKK